MKNFVLTILTILNIAISHQIARASQISLDRSMQNLIVSGNRESDLAQNDVNRQPLASIESRIHEIINRYRQSRHLDRLALEPLVSAAAQAHSQEMAAKSSMSHEGFHRRIENLQSAIPCKKTGENVAANRGHSQPELVAIKDWLDSPAHLQNIIGSYNITGIGVAKNSQGEYYFTQIFARTVTWSGSKFRAKWDAKQAIALIHLQHFSSK